MPNLADNLTASVHRSPGAIALRQDDQTLTFAELERAPEHIHSYRITRLGLWNARAAGHTADDMLTTLDRWSRFPVPASVSIDIRETVNRYGRLVIERDDEGTLILRATDTAVLAEVAKNKRIQPLLTGHPAPGVFTENAAVVSVRP